MRWAGVLDLELHEVKQVGAAGDELGAGDARCRRGRIGGRVRALVGESPHAPLLSPSIAGDLGDRLDDVGIGAAAADVAAHAFSHLDLAELGRRRHVCW